MCQCVSRGWWEQDNSQLEMDGLELENCTFSAFELDHPILRTCAHGLDNFQWGALELDSSN